MTSDLLRVVDLDAVEWPVDAVFVCDRTVEWALPAAATGRAVRVDAGEGLKTLSAVEALADRVLDLRATRPLTLVAIGGGSVGDAVGFLASILWRGVGLWHVPTTLLAAVDSAHGGKTAVNLRQRKNQLGTFWPASRVVLAESLLAELPRTLRLEGLAELVKGLWLGGCLLEHLDDGTSRLAARDWQSVRTTLMSCLEAAIDVKRQIVALDPREERDIRTTLNLGHTVAHAVELSDGLSHGVAVAWGLTAAAILSHRRGLLELHDRNRLLRHCHPLLGTRAPLPGYEAFAAAIERDKKHRSGRLRSVLLEGPGEAIVVDDVTPHDWFEGLSAARALFHAPLRLAFEGANEPTTIDVDASKSELNRMLAIAALRPGETTIEGESQCEDVVNMRKGLRALAQGEVADAGNGGTTFRFLVAVAAAGLGPARVTIGTQLAERPHDELFDALRRAGATVERTGDDEFMITPLPSGTLEFSVSAERSSQFASALALIAASGRRVNLRISRRLVSRGYFEMTLALLRRAGVRVSRDGRNHRLTPSDELAAPVTLSASPDASSLAVWAVLTRLGVDVVVEPPGALQPDAAVEGLLWQRDRAEPVELDLSGTPDLACVLAAYAALSDPEVRLVGAPHLRVKESNRIERLADAFGSVGVRVTPLDDGLSIPAGRQKPVKGATFPTSGDHRQAMAALVLSTASQLTVEDPRVVNKSYPNLWLDACSAGWKLDISDSTCRFPDT